MVLGAGVVGTVTAWLLAGAGHRVQLVDRAAGPAEETSDANGAQLSYSHTDALASPALLGRLPAIALGADPAIRIAPMLSPRFLQWSFRFLLNGIPAAERANSRRLFDLAQRARTIFQELTRNRTLEFDHRSPGKLVLYRSASAFRSAAERARLKVAWGESIAVLDPDGCVETEPSLDGVRRDIAGGIFAPHDACGDTRAFCRALLSDAARSADLETLFSTDIDRLVRHGDRIASVETGRGALTADAYVLALGPWSTDLARTACLRLPIWPIRGYSATLPVGAAAPTVSVTDAARRLVFCRLGDRIRIAGLADIGGRSDDPRRIAQLVAMARDALPLAADWGGPMIGWSGARPATPDSLPLVGRTRLGNLFLNTGHGMYGWTLAPATAADLVREIGQEN